MATNPLSAGFERNIIRIAGLVVIGFALLPICTVVLMSFTSSTTLQFPPPGLSLRWYGELWNLVSSPDQSSNRLLEAFLTSTELALMTSILCVFAGVPVSYLIMRHKFFGRVALEEALAIPIVFPSVVLGVALLTLLSRYGIRLGIFQIVLAHSVIGLPFMVRNCLAALAGIDENLEAAAQTLGATAVRAFAATTLPLMMSGIASGALLVFVISFNEFTLAYFLYTVDVFPLSIWLFQQSNTSFSPVVLAISAVITVFNVLIILLVDRITGLGQSEFDQ